MKSYDQTIRLYLYDKSAEKAEVTTPHDAQGPLLYLPRHAVSREDKVATKCRVIFGPSSHGSESRILNETLHSAHNLNLDLLGFLL